MFGCKLTSRNKYKTNPEQINVVWSTSVLPVHENHESPQFLINHKNEGGKKITEIPHHGKLI